MTGQFFHPKVRISLYKTLSAPTQEQFEAWPTIKSGNHTLNAAPTGSGKTLAWFSHQADRLNEMMFAFSEGCIDLDTASDSHAVFFGFHPVYTSVYGRLHFTLRILLRIKPGFTVPGKAFEAP